MKPLTLNVSRSPESEDRYPCWSPDGRRVCFVSDRESTTNLWVCDADGSKVPRLNRTPAVCYMPSWQGTPDGERIVFGKHGAVPRMVGIIQTFGQLIPPHPHIHALVAEGVFLPESGAFLPLPKLDTESFRKPASGLHSVVCQFDEATARAAVLGAWWGLRSPLP